MFRRSHRIPTLIAVSAIAALALTGCVSGPPSADQVAGDFDAKISPAWSVDVPGIYGEATISGDLVAVYAQDAKDGMRLEVRNTTTGKLVWKHVSSPGGAWGAPLFSETSSASRPYPIPTIKPFVVTVGAGDKAKPVVVFTERVLTDTNEIYNPDILRAADLRTGKLLKLTAPDYDQDDFSTSQAKPDEKGNIIVEPYSPFRLCGDGPTVCVEDNDGGFYSLDLKTREVTNTKPEFDPFDSATEYQRGWGAEYVQVHGDEYEKAGDVLIARLKDGKELWRDTATDLFGQGGGDPAELRDFTMVDGELLIQGYRSILQDTDTDTLQYDYALSRNLAAVDPDTGKVLWLAKGADSLCFAVNHFDQPATGKAKVIPVCHATEGAFYYDIASKSMIKEQAPKVSVAGLDPKTGKTLWEVARAGDDAILEHARQLEQVYSSGGQFAVVDTAKKKVDGSDDKPKVGILDLSTGKLTPVPAKSSYLCESERDGVQLKFQGSVFVNGANPIALEYPAGWFQFRCDADGKPTKTWTKGAIEVAGLHAADGLLIVVTKDGLAGFKP